jgi:hypothetical protein
MANKTGIAEKTCPEDSFRALVRNCINSFSTFYDDTLSLDYNKVTDTKVRAMILRDNGYRSETKFIRAKKIMDNIKEIDELGQLAAKLGDSADKDTYDVRGNGKKKKATSIDKDMLNMRFKAAQEKRELLSEINNQGADELDAVYIYSVFTTKDDLQSLETIEVFDGDGDNEDILDELTGKKSEQIPVGSRVLNTHIQAGRSKGAADDDGEEPDLIIDDNGDIVGIVPCK